MPRKNLIAGNWKMNNTIPEAVVLAQEISNRMERDWLQLVGGGGWPPLSASSWWMWPSARRLWTSSP